MGEIIHQDEPGQVEELKEKVKKAEEDFMKRKREEEQYIETQLAGKDEDTQEVGASQEKAESEKNEAFSSEIKEAAASDMTLEEFLEKQAKAKNEAKFDALFKKKK